MPGVNVLMQHNAFISSFLFLQTNLTVLFGDSNTSDEITDKKAFSSNEQPLICS